MSEEGKAFIFIVDLQRSNCTVSVFELPLDFPGRRAVNHSLCGIVGAATDSRIRSCTVIRVYSQFCVSANWPPTPNGKIKSKWSSLKKNAKVLRIHRDATVAVSA